MTHVGHRGTRFAGRATFAVALAGALSVAACGGARFSSTSWETPRETPQPGGKSTVEGREKGMTSETNQGSVVGARKGVGDSPNGSPKASPNADIQSDKEAIIVAEAIKKVEEACAKGKRETKPLILSFPATNGSDDAVCKWSDDGKDDVIRGYHMQTTHVELPTGALICSSRVTAPKGTWVYDDEIVLAMNGVVLLTSQSKYLRNGETNVMPRVGGGYSFDWPSLSKLGFKNEHAAPEDRYCYGGSRAKECIIPVTQKEGEVRVDLPTDALAPLALKAHGEKKVEFTLWVTGDNEPKIDCKHSGITLAGEIEYVVAP